MTGVVAALGAATAGEGETLGASSSTSGDADGFGDVAIFGLGDGERWAKAPATVMAAAGPAEGQLPIMLGSPIRSKRARNSCFKVKQNTLSSCILCL